MTTKAVRNMINSHCDELEEYSLKYFGEEYKNLSINLCQGVNESERTVASKVYGKGYFITTHDEKGNVIDHDTESF